jgi:hypothetical protein
VKLTSKVLAVLGVVLVGGVVTASVPTCTVFAQGSACSQSCKAAYGDCYKSTQNRSACQSQLQRCLEGCMAGKRG